MIGCAGEFFSRGVKSENVFNLKKKSLSRSFHGHFPFELGIQFLYSLKA